MTAWCVLRAICFACVEIRPAGGEIDVLEGVHLSQVSATTLHAGPGCTRKFIKQNVTTNLVLNTPHLEALSRNITEKIDLNHPLRTGGHSAPYAGPPAMLTKTEAAMLAGAKAEL